MILREWVLNLPGLNLGNNEPEDLSGSLLWVEFSSVIIGEQSGTACSVYWRSSSNRRSRDGRTQIGGGQEAGAVPGTWRREEDGERIQ